MGLPIESGVAEPNPTADTTDSRRWIGEENLVAKGEAVVGRGFRRTDDVDETVDKPLGLPVEPDKEGMRDLFGKGSGGGGGGLLTRGAVERSDEAKEVSG